MESIFNINNYRKKLIDHYNSSYDKNTYDIRKKNIDNYADDFLLIIIDNTKKFSMMILDKLEKENNVYNNKIYTTIDFDEDYKEKIITNGCLGGTPSDIIVYPYGIYNDFCVSKLLISEFFAGFKYYIDDNVSEVLLDNEFGTFYAQPKFHISGNIEDFIGLKERNEIKKEYTSKLVKVLNKKLGG